MMDRLAKVFASAKSERRGVFIPFTVAGYPDQQTSLDIIKSMIDSGASALELGLAFSDPIADGPIIQTATHATLSKGYSAKQAFELFAAVRTYKSDVAINLLVYYNMILAPGVDNFYKQAAAAGVDSVLVADLPVEHAEEVAPVAKRHGVAPVFMISPLTGKDRLERIAAHASGYLYTVSRLGITGVESRYDAALAELIANARQVTDLPICVGFGISEPAQAKAVMDLGADGVITGSRIIQMIQQASPAQLKKELSEFVKSMTASVSKLKNTANAST
jgi:tryptophan synthase alpha chain